MFDLFITFLEITDFKFKVFLAKFLNLCFLLVDEVFEIIHIIYKMPDIFILYIRGLFKPQFSPRSLATKELEFIKDIKRLNNIPTVRLNK